MKIKYVSYDDRVDEQVVKELKKEKYDGVITRSRGTDNIDFKACAKHGLLARGLDDYCSDAVAQWGFHALQQLMINYIPYGLELNKKTCLVMGSEGAIGKKLVRIAEGYRMNVERFDPVLSDMNEQYLITVLLPKVDVVFIAVPLNSGTVNYLKFGRFRAMAKKPFIVDCTGRHGLWDERTVLVALMGNFIKGFASDLMPSSFELQNQTNTYFRNHVAAKSHDTLVRQSKFIRKAAREMRKEFKVKKKGVVVAK